MEEKILLKTIEEAECLTSLMSTTNIRINRTDKNLQERIKGIDESRVAYG